MSDQDSDLVKNLRAEIAKRDSAINDLKGQVKGYVMGDVLSSYGLDPNGGAGKLVLDSYDGDLSTDAATAWLDEQGFEKPEPTPEQETPGLAARVAQAEVLGKADRDGDPPGEKKMTVDEHRTLMSADPQAAIQAWRSGRVQAPTPG